MGSVAMTYLKLGLLIDPFSNLILLSNQLAYGCGISYFYLEMELVAVVLKLFVFDTILTILTRIKKREYVQ